MRVEIVTEPRRFAELQPGWDKLAKAAGRLGLFSGFSWSFEWWRALGGGRELRLVVTHDRDEVTGILPLFEERRRGARTLAFVGSAGGGSDYLDMLANDDRTRRTLVDHARTLDADLFVLDDFDEASPTIPFLRDRARELGTTLEIRPRHLCPFLPIRTSYAAHLAQVPRRDNLRRREKWLAQQPGYRIEVETEARSVPAFLERFHRLHRARWEADGGTQAFADGRLVAFHARVAERFADEGRLRLWTMWVAGEAVAVAYTFDDGDRSLYYQSGFLPAWGAKSAGLVLFAKYVEDAFRRGLREIDFLRGSEPYKLEWTREARHTASVVWPLTTIGRAAIAGEHARTWMRRGVRRALPAALANAVSRRVRATRIARVTDQ